MSLNYQPVPTLDQENTASPPFTTQGMRETIVGMENQTKVALPQLRERRNNAPSASEETQSETFSGHEDDLEDGRYCSPSTDEGIRRNRNRLKLYRAAVEGKWEDAKKIFDEDENTMTMRLNAEGMTPLLVAANCGKSDFVVKIVKLLDEEDLDMVDQLRRNALHHAALACKVKAAEAIISKRGSLILAKEAYGYTPLFYAARWRLVSLGMKMLRYLYYKTPAEHIFEGHTAPNLIVAIAASEAHDIVLKVLEKYPRLAIEKNMEGWNILHILANQPSVFPSGDTTSTVKKRVYQCLKIVSEEEEQKHKNALKLVEFVCEELKTRSDSYITQYFLPPEFPAVLSLATSNGVEELVEMCLKNFPDLCWYASGAERNKKLLIHVAVKHRQHKIFNCITTLIGDNAGSYANTLDEEGKNNILHLAAQLAPIHRLQSVPGPAFQMQNELMWFNAVKKIIYREQMITKNADGKTPEELFYEKHDQLMKDAKEWTKDTSNSCMVVAALVATVAFASMITVPGGLDNGTGKPVLYKKGVFILFSISNALSMICSAVALLMFLSLQTSRFTADDFLESLPKNLLRGLLALFFAVATMMIAFGTAIGIALQTRVSWAYIPITIVACFPAIIFIKLQLPLLFQTLGIEKDSKSLLS